jgi:hypothetical protein
MMSKINYKALAACALVFFLCGNSWAITKAEEQAAKEEQRNPIGCQDLGYQFELKVLELIPDAAGERNSIYFVLNTLSVPINLYNMRGDDSTTTMFLNNIIQPKQWGVLATNEKYLKYICTTNNGKPYGKIVDCAESVRVCEFVKVRFGLNNRGNLWLVKSNTRNGAVSDVVHYGIIPQ